MARKASRPSSQARVGPSREVVACPWKAARRKRRLAQLRRLATNPPPREVVVYADEIDIHLNPKIGPDWACTIHVILDNCVIHKSRVFQLALARFPRIRLHFLPPYCPDANKIERQWQDLHANVTRNHTHRTIRQLINAVRRYLDTHYLSFCGASYGSYPPHHQGRAPARLLWNGIRLHHLRRAPAAVGARGIPSKPLLAPARFLPDGLRPTRAQDRFRRPVPRTHE
ncbi:MAG: transposase [Candidatus Eisenbacteria sp.]|nr:transposase [Candidatus Eisenbacteria bacterium]